MTKPLAEQLAAAEAELARLERVIAAAPCAEVGHRWKFAGGKHAGCVGGKNLACFCRLDLPCHVSILLELANRQICEEV